MSFREQALKLVREECEELMKFTVGCSLRSKEIPNAKHIRIARISDGRDHSSIRVVQNALWDRTYDNKAHVLEEFEVIGHTPHLEHWLRTLPENYFVNKKGFLGKWERHDESRSYKLFNPPIKYDLTKNGENQSEEFYEAYCKIFESKTNLENK